MEVRQVYAKPGTCNICKVGPHYTFLLIPIYMLDAHVKMLLKITCVKEEEKNDSLKSLNFGWFRDETKLVILDLRFFVVLSLCLWNYTFFFNVNLLLL